MAGFSALLLARAAALAPRQDEAQVSWRPSLGPAHVPLQESRSRCAARARLLSLAPKRKRGRYRHAVVTWTDDVDEILVSDLAAGFAYLTPARGVVISPMAPLALRDREAGTVTVTTSQAMWKKLDRIRRNSGVAIAYHAREYGLIGQVRIRACPGPGELPDLRRPRLA